MTFEDKIACALGLLKEDKPVAFKHDGLKKKTASGAHKFDPPVEYVQMKHDNTWGTKSEQDKLS